MDRFNNKQLIIIGCVVFAIAILLFVLSSCTKDDFDEHKEMFNDSNYTEKNKDYLESQAQTLTLYANYIFVEDRHEMTVSELDSESLVQLLNVLLSGHSKEHCFEEKFLQDKLSDYFNINNYTFAKEGSNYYYENKKICFSERLVNNDKMPVIDKYEDAKDMIIVTITYNKTRWQYFYKREDKKIYLYSIYKEPIS